MTSTPPPSSILQKRSKSSSTSGTYWITWLQRIASIGLRLRPVAVVALGHRVGFFGLSWMYVPPLVHTILRYGSGRIRSRERARRGIPWMPTCMTNSRIEYAKASEAIAHATIPHVLGEVPEGRRTGLPIGAGRAPRACEHHGLVLDLFPPARAMDGRRRVCEVVLELDVGEDGLGELADDVVLGVASPLGLRRFSTAGANTTSLSSAAGWITQPPHECLHLLRGRGAHPRAARS